MNKSQKNLALPETLHQFIKECAERRGISMVRLVAEKMNFMLPPLTEGIMERKYPVDTLEVGQSVFIPWLEPLANGSIYSPRSNAKISLAIAKYARRTGKAFRTEGSHHGLTVVRYK